MTEYAYLPEIAYVFFEITAGNNHYTRFRKKTDSVSNKRGGLLMCMSYQQSDLIKDYEYKKKRKNRHLLEE